MSQDVLILEKKKNCWVSATFHEKVGVKQLIEAEQQWKPFRIAAKQRLLDAGKTEKEVKSCLLQHSHWDWALKSQSLEDDLLALQAFGIELGGKWQGLALAEVFSMHSAHLAPDQGKPLVYIEFLESAPWNQKNMVDEPRYGSIGWRLIEAAIRLSISEGFKGRVGLYALPQADAFYRKCGMVWVEGCVKCGMRLFELTQEAAKAFLEGGRYVNKNEQ
jgi:hypothetical protein